MPMIQTDSQHYSDIADAIRDMSGSSEVFYPADMAAGVRSIPQTIAIQPIIYSLEEREVGVWTDGKPLYQKSYQISNFTYNDWVDAIDVTALNIDRCCKTIGSIKRNNTNGLYISFDGSYYETNTYMLDIRYYNGNIQYIIKGYNDFNNMIATLLYTKTTDTPGSGTWTPSGVPAHHYSTEEQVIGTWIDGEPLYEKSYTYTQAFTSGYNILSFDLNSDCQIVNQEECAICTDNTFIKTNSISGNSFMVVNTQYSRTVIDISYGLAGNVRTIIVTVRYTKTTD